MLPGLSCCVTYPPAPLLLSDSVLLPDLVKKRSPSSPPQWIYTEYSVFLCLWQIQTEELCWAKWISFNLNIEVPDCTRKSPLPLGSPPVLKKHIDYEKMVSSFSVALAVMLDTSVSSMRETAPLGPLFLIWYSVGFANSKLFRRWKQG